jgi:surfeit locus 1 family protein
MLDHPLRGMQAAPLAPRPRLWPAALATTVAVAILIALGIWQIQRLHWKEGLLAQIAAAQTAPPVELGDETPNRFARVRTQGTFHDERLALYGAEVRGVHMGAQVLQVLDRPGERPVLVMLGWVATDAGPVVPVLGHADLTGYVRLPENSSWLSAADDLEARHFYSLNPTTIGASLGAADVEPFTLVLLGDAKRPGAAQPAESLPEPVNNHLQYALTWFGLAAALVGVFAAWAWSGRTKA